ncbi:MAG: TIGR01212 family radical SAM protein [Bacteroidota bacterium]|nr:TIGR01212 family radical SAM protein [Bacteroidota bacterium]
MIKRASFAWGHERRFNSYTEYIRRQFGSRVQKVAVDAGFTCPNRDGTKGTGGCTYCDNRTFNPSYCNPSKSVAQQIAEGIEFHARRYRRASHFLVYFQPYSNTYGSLDFIREKYEEALAVPGVAGLVIGTRPDCMDEEKLDYLSSLASRYYIQVEYGIESVCEKTLMHINRGHSFSEVPAILEKTRAHGIHTGGHFIFGLPCETPEKMMDSAKIISALPLDTVKFHQLQIIKDTAIENEYIEHPERFHTFNLDEYIDFIIRFIEKLNPELVIERFTGEAPPRFLEKSHFGLIRNDEVLRKIEKELEIRDTWQGKYYA